MNSNISNRSGAPFINLNRETSSVTISVSFKVSIDPLRTSISAP